MCTICALARTFDPARHDDGQDIMVGNTASARITEGADAAENTSTVYGISPGDSFTGTISSGSDEDWIYITLQENTRYEFSHEGSPTGAGTLSDPLVRLYDSGGNQIVSNDDGGTGYNSLLSYTATYTGTYYISADAYEANTGTYTLTASQGDIAQPQGFASLDDLALQLTDVFWGDRQFTFDTSRSNVITVDITGLTADGQQLARWAMEAWEMVADLEFREVTSGEMITMDDEYSGAYAYTPNARNAVGGVELNVSTAWLDSQGTTLDSYSFQTYVHELGHAIGLGHMGDYDGNASYARDNDYLNDSWQVSVMSYFNQNENTSINASYGFTAGPMMADVLAIQNLYGAADANSATAGDTTYGANSNLGNYLDQLFNWVATGNTTGDVTGNAMVFNITDRGGFDRIDLNFSNTNDRIDLRQEAFSNVSGLIGNLSISRGTEIEAALTGSGNDTVFGNSVNNVIETRGGNDSVQAGAGNDRVYGGTGADTIRADGGADSVWGGDGTDLVYLGAGNDSFFDNAQGGALGSDTVFAGLGDDTVQGGNGNDIFHGDDGNDVINARLGDDTIYGGNNFDTISAGGGNDVVYGGNGRDLVFLNLGNDVYIDNDQGGDLGRDVVYTGFGDDTVQGGAGNDTFFGEAGNDVILGRLGNDSIYAGDNFDIIDAGAGNDLVFGGAGRDIIDLGSGNDRYVDTEQGGDLGRDVITGGTGADTFVFGALISEDTITDFQIGIDRLELARGLVGNRSTQQVEDQMFRFDGGEAFFFAGNGQAIYLDGITNVDGIAGSIDIV